MSTYRADQEVADRALTRLISADLPLPTAANDVDRLLQLRHVSLALLVERLDHISLAGGNARRLSPGAAAIASDPVNALGYVLRGMAPTTPANFSIVELTQRSGEPTDHIIEEYREVARSLILANHTLTHAVEQPWLNNPADAWPIVTDLASNTEAMLILDERLEQVGILPQATDDDSLRRRAEGRLITSQAARTARWYSTTDTVDLAVAAEPQHVPSGPVRIISRPADLAPAQRRLASYLRPLNGHNVFHGQDVAIDSATLGLIVTNQKFLCDRLAATARNSLSSATTAHAFADRSELLSDVLVQLRNYPLVDLGDKGRNQRALWQQTEITRWLRKHPTPALEDRELLGLAEATDQALTMLGTAAYRELTRPTGTLRSSREDDPSMMLPISHKNPLVRSLRALTDAPPPFRAPGAAWAGPRHSESLRRTLDATPPETRRRPSPYARPTRRAPGTDLER